jgi:hypothetical protein
MGAGLIGIIIAAVAGVLLAVVAGFGLVSLSQGDHSTIDAPLVIYGER